MFTPAYGTQDKETKKEDKAFSADETFQEEEEESTQKGPATETHTTSWWVNKKTD